MLAAPPAGKRPSTTLARSVPSQPIAYAWPETPPTGLRKFNLGTIPASVTPPGTWRKAAWFAVGTSVFVVLALGFAAFRLVGNPRRATVIDALPGQPSQQLLITELPGGATDGSTTSSTRPTTSTRTTTTTRPSTTKSTTKRTVQGGDVAADAAPDREHPAHANPVQTTMAPARNTVEPLSKPAADPDQLGDRTELYYTQVCDNPSAAYELTTGAMRAEGPEGIEARYANIHHIEVKEITIDPNWSYTRSVLKVVRKDGSTVTIQRELTFTSGANPKISSDTGAQ